MKKTLMATILAAAAFAGNALGGTPNKYPGAITIPFEFKVQNTTMPAGEYRVKRVSQGFATVMNMETGQMVHVLRQNGPDNSKKILYFKEVAGQKVLERVG